MLQYNIIYAMLLSQLMELQIVQYNVWSCQLCCSGSQSAINKQSTNYFFFNVPNPSGRTRPWGSLSSVTDMSNRSMQIIFLRSKARPVRRADKLAAICEPIA
jgi:hypothetical protein